MNMKKIIGFFTCMLVSASLWAQDGKYHLLIGTYTAPGKSEGIYVYDFDTRDASTNYKSKVVLGSPSYFAVTNDRKFVYTVSEDRSKNINALSFDSKTGDLKFLNSVPSGSGGPTYISVDEKGKYVFVGNYGGGTLTALPINADGTLGSDIQDMRELNTLSRNMSLAEIESGTINKAIFNVSGNIRTTNGTLKLYYNNLKVNVLKNDDETGELKKRGLISALANTIIIKNDNPDEDGELRIGQTDAERLNSGSFFNLMWKSIFSGLKESVGFTLGSPETQQVKPLSNKEQRKLEREQRRNERKEKREAEERTKSKEQR